MFEEGGGGTPRWRESLGLDWVWIVGMIPGVVSPLLLTPWLRRLVHV